METHTKKINKIIIYSSLEVERLDFFIVLCIWKNVGGGWLECVSQILTMI